MRTIMRTKLLTLAVAVCLLPSVAVAQETQKEKQGEKKKPDSGISDIRKRITESRTHRLLQYAGVQEELKLNESQKEDFDKGTRKFATAHRAMIARLGNATAEKRRAEYRKYSDSQAAFHRKFIQSLSTEQKARLRQLYLQSVGVMVFIDDGVRERLKITRAQRTKISGFTRTNLDKKRKLFKNARVQRPAVDELRKKMDALDAATMKECNAVLTESQRKSLAKAYGKMVDASKLRRSYTRRRRN